jgi:alkaline phosphatase D
MRNTLFIFLLISLNVNSQIERIYCSEINDQLKSKGVFPFGVASGDPTEKGVILWTALNPFKLQTFRIVSCQVSEQANFKEIARTYQYEVEISRGLSVKMNASNLSQDKQYFYRFIYGEDTSAIGKTKTIGTNPDHLKFAVVSCSNYEWGYFNAYESIANIPNLDFVVHLGDYIYEYGPGVYGDKSLNRVHLPAKELLTIQDYRSRYAQYRLDEQLQKVHQNTPFISVWDDHEIANDTYTEGAQNHQEEDGDWNERKHAAQQAYFEWLPITDNTKYEIQREFNFGSLANLFMLDERLKGRTKQPTLENASLESNSILGKIQYDWLVNSMNRSETSWNILGNQVLFSRINIPAHVEGLKKSMDTWQGYLNEKNQLFDEFHKISLAKYQANNLIVLTGDIHSSLALKLEHKNKPLGVEWVAPSVTSANYNERYSSCKTKTVERKLRNKTLNPALDFVNLRHHGYVLIELSTSHAKSTWFKVKVTKPGKTKSKKIHSESIQKIITLNG